MNNPRVLSVREQDRMRNAGWYMVCANFKESEKNLFNRLSEAYEQVKIYYATTCVRGYYHKFAMCKGHK